MDDTMYKSLLAYSDKLVETKFQILKETGITGGDLLNHVLKKWLEQEQGVGRSVSDSPYIKRSIKNHAFDLVRKKNRQKTFGGHEEDEMEHDVFVLTSPLDDHTVFEDARNFARDEVREEHVLKRKTLKAQPDEETVSETRRNEALSALKGRLAEINKKLKQCERKLARSARVDRHAVFLFYLRSRFAYRMSKTLLEIDEDIAATVELLLPWDDAQRLRVIRQGWPNLQELWEHFRRFFDVPPHRIDPHNIGTIVKEVTKGSRNLSSAAWYQWVRRAKKDLINCMGEQAWNQLFVPILGSGKDKKLKRTVMKEEK